MAKVVETQAGSESDLYTSTDRQHESISILTHKKIRNMNQSFKVYNDSAILNSVLEFPVTHVWTETLIFTYVLNVH